jgi:hypothetical protein
MDGMTRLIRHDHLLVRTYTPNDQHICFATISYHNGQTLYDCVNYSYPIHSMNQPLVRPMPLTGSVPTVDKFLIKESMPRGGKVIDPACPTLTADRYVGRKISSRHLSTFPRYTLCRPMSALYCEHGTEQSSWV